MPLNDAHQPLYEVKAGLFKGLAHPLRIQVLELLCDQEEHSVAEIQAHTGLEASHLSQHLAVLRKHRLVTSIRRGSHVYYEVGTDEVIEILGAARRFLIDLLTTQGNQLADATALPKLPEISK